MKTTPLTPINDGRTRTVIAAVAELKCTENGEQKTKPEKIKNDVTITINGKQVEIQFPDSLIRDYFAGQALAGSLASQTPESYWAFVSSGSAANDSAKNGIARLCYDLADAMLAAREVKP